MSQSDDILRDHLQFCKRNAIYTSKTNQNDVIGIVWHWIGDTITENLRNNDDAVFAVIADEETDTTSNQEILFVWDL
jgi:hypothetical protein